MTWHRNGKVHVELQIPLELLVHAKSEVRSSVEIFAEIVLIVSLVAV